MNLVIFDLDNTLLDGDSDYAWGEFICSKGIVNSDLYHQKNQKFYQDYQLGELNIEEYLSFSLSPLQKEPLNELLLLRDEFILYSIMPMISQSAIDLIKKHKTAGDYTLIITATNNFITEPIAKHLGVDDILATTAQMQHGKFTGKVEGIPCFQSGKIDRLNLWLSENKFHFTSKYFYSDSINDLPLLELVDFPVTVNADEQLDKIAKSKGWPQIHLKC